MKDKVVVITYGYVYLKRNKYHSWYRVKQFQYYFSSCMHFDIHKKIIIINIINEFLRYIFFKKCLYNRKHGYMSEKWTMK